MSDSTHLLIPFASSRDQGCVAALATLALPNLEKLLARLAPGAADRGDEDSLSMPHERVLARACGLPSADGLIPWAAWQVAQAGRDPGAHAWAHVTPCHWRVGQDHVAMGHPHDLQLEARESQALLAAMQPFFEGDGIALEYDSPVLWLARGELFRDLATASLARVVGRAVDNWIPRAPEARVLRRLQQEMQMLLYTHEVNEQRDQAGLAPINSFWISDTGALPPATRTEMPPGLQVNQALRESALRGDWHGWVAAWQQLDATGCAGLLRSLDAGEDVTLTLCGDVAAQSWIRPAGAGVLRRMVSLFGGKRALAQLESL
ncbi:MAG TPA: phosphoglycerate mutase [Ramlibacter sp.]|nr:phosphoglycerate mutase [Ramlibacter sp.]